MAVVDYAKEIADSCKILKDFRKSPEQFGKEKEILGLMKLRYELYYSQIHNFLAKSNTQKAEEDIQKLVREIYSLDLPVCEAKINKFQNAIKVMEKKGNTEKIEIYYQYLQEWLILYEDDYALSAFRILENFALFMEWDKKDKVWQPSLDPYGDNGYTGVSKPFFYYFNQMVLKKDIKFISKQMFTGGGKSYSNQMAIAWLMGVDINNDVLCVLGNPSLVLTNTRGIVEIVKNPRYVKVFPQFEKYLQKETGKKGETISVVSDDIFSTCIMKDGKLSFADSDKPMNIRIISKDTPIDGIRAKYLFLDDICRSKDATNLKQHNIDISNFWNSWWKRNYGTDNFYIVISGTAYSVFDIMTHLIKYYSKGKMQKTSRFKYAYMSLDNSCAFIKIPKIDDDLNRSTYPQRFPYEEAIRIRERDYNSFMAMEQQQPQNPETSPLCYEKLSTYETLPNNMSDYSYACLDPARTGKNFVTMGIHRVCKEVDKFNTMVERHYLVDCIFQLKQMEDLYDEICDKIKRHNIIRLHIENNTDTSLKFLIEKMLHEKMIYNCEISEKFSAENKEEKIRELVYTNEGYFKNIMVYPAMNMYAPSSQMGKFMLYLTAYDYYQKMEYDDSIDEECMYIEKFVDNRKPKNEKAVLIYL